MKVYCSRVCYVGHKIGFQENVRLINLCGSVRLGLGLELGPSLRRPLSMDDRNRARSDTLLRTVCH